MSTQGKKVKQGRKALAPSLQSEGSRGLVAFIDKLSEIELATPIAKLNEVSISDNKGGRILL